MDQMANAFRKSVPPQPLNKSDFDPNPFKQFQKWFTEALDAEQNSPHAMTLATAASNGKPSIRMMLLRSFNDHGFTFYSNCLSQKGREIQENPWAALNFYWPVLNRQVNIQGNVEIVAEYQSDIYFHRRHRDSQLVSWAYKQSQTVSSREILNQRLQELNEEYQDREVSRPPYWGGCCLLPDSVEFWQKSPDHLHDRLRYSRLDDGNLIIERVSP